MGQSTQSHAFQLSGNNPSHIYLPSLNYVPNQWGNKLRGGGDMTLEPHIVYQELKNDARWGSCQQNLQWLLFPLFPHYSAFRVIGSLWITL